MNINSIRISVEEVPINLIKVNLNNPRRHNRAQRRKLAALMREFKYVSPVVLDEGDILIAGHLRLEAARENGMATIPAIRITHLSDAQKRALNIADNRIAEDGGWDKQALQSQIQAICGLDPDFDLSLTGLEIGELDLLIHSDSHASDEVELETAMRSRAQVSKLNDTWRLGDHRVFCGDSTLSTSYPQLMSGKKAEAMFGDFPYNVRINGHAVGKGKTQHPEFPMASGEMSEEQFLKFLRVVIDALIENTTDGSIHFICMDWAHIYLLLQAGYASYSELKNICIWNKDRAGMGSLYRSQYEMIIVFKNGKGRHQNNILLGKYGRDRSNVWCYPSISNFGRAGEEGNLAALHPTVKPLAMVADALLDCSSRGDIVLDPFLGSGTTLIAAERTGRICYGMELDPLYVDVAIRRWQAHTGEHAVHLGTGKTFNQLEAGVAHVA